VSSATIIAIINMGKDTKCISFLSIYFFGECKTLRTRPDLITGGDIPRRKGYS
jgi:hypothetical protein